MTQPKLDLSKFDLATPGSHADHMLRQTRTQLMQLSQMADTKAGMLITISSLIITLSVSLLIKPEFATAATILISFCILTILLAAYATMPKFISHTRNKTPDTNSERFNILFFSDFIKLDYQTFFKEMEGVIKDPGLAYSTQVKEIYQMGQYLAARKFRFVTLSYISFISGLIISVSWAVTKIHLS